MKILFLGDNENEGRKAREERVLALSFVLNNALILYVKVTYVRPTVSYLGFFFFFDLEHLDKC
jgi:hypothetical protein